MITREQLQQLDDQDPLAFARARFLLRDHLIYLDGNSLGPLPKCTPGHLNKVMIEEWGDDLIASWNKHGWVDLPLRLGDRLGELIGAVKGQVAVADSTSVNVFKVLSAALAAQPGRQTIVSERGNFPTDLYVAQGLAERFDCEVILVEHVDEIEDVVDERCAALMLTHVDFRSGYMHDMESVTRTAHDAGALCIWDLAHSAGALPVDLDGCKVDMAVGCGYKYLNGGPGAPAFVYVNLAFQERFRPMLQGWFAHASPFSFSPVFEPAKGILRALCGTPPLLSLVALEAGLTTFDDVAMTQLRAKSISLSETFMNLLEQGFAGEPFAIQTPRNQAQRGSQVAVSHPQAFALIQALIARDVIGDFREPDVMRFGLTPLYTRHVDVWDAVERLRAVLDSGDYLDPRFNQRVAVT